MPPDGPRCQPKHGPLRDSGRHRHGWDRLGLGQITVLWAMPLGHRLACSNLGPLAPHIHVPHLPRVLFFYALVSPPHIVANAMHYVYLLMWSSTKLDFLLSKLHRPVLKVLCGFYLGPQTMKSLV